MHITVIIPALNEAGNIRRLLTEIPPASALGASSLTALVVDNGSTDATAAEAANNGAVVISEPRRGYGYACAAGVKAAPDADVYVFMDGDGSFDPAEMPLLLQPIVAGDADLVLGTRTAHIAPGAMPPHQQFGNQLVSALMRLFYRLEVTDLGPYRAIRRDLLLSLDMSEMTFGWPTEMMVKAARRQARIVEVPIHYRKRWSGQSKVSGTLRGTLLATYFILGVTLRYAFSANQSSSDKSRR
ncbi:MAG: glycosyltransferase family 2 protein [Chloroflexota bacterium]